MHKMLTRILAAGTPVTPQQASDESVDLKRLALGR